VPTSLGAAGLGCNRKRGAEVPALALVEDDHVSAHPPSPASKPPPPPLPSDSSSPLFFPSTFAFKTNSPDILSSV
ncbi:MAG: hypothetical protein Q9173_000669, partial [Seirophora scorigena]